MNLTTVSHFKPQVGCASPDTAAALPDRAAVVSESIASGVIGAPVLPPFNPNAIRVLTTVARAQTPTEPNTVSVDVPELEIPATISDFCQSLVAMEIVDPTGALNVSDDTDTLKLELRQPGLPPKQMTLRDEADLTLRERILIESLHFIILNGLRKVLPDEQAERMAGFIKSVLPDVLKNEKIDAATLEKLLNRAFSENHVGALKGGALGILAGCGIVALANVISRCFGNPKDNQLSLLSTVGLLCSVGAVIGSILLSDSPDTLWMKATQTQPDPAGVAP